MSSNESRSLSRNMLYNTVYRVLNLLFPLISTTYIARILLPDGVGKVTYALNIVQYFIIFAGLGINNYGIREIAKSREDIEKRSRIFTELFSLNFVSTTICLLAYYQMVTLYSNFQKEKSLYLIVGTLIFFNYINVDWFYQGMEEYRYIAIRNTIVKLVSIVFLVIFVRKQKDYVIYALIYCFALGGNNCLNLINLKGKVKPVFKGISIKRHIKTVLILFASTISIELYTMLDVTMLGVLCDDSVVGYYNNASKLARMVNSLISSIGAVLLPRLSYYYENDRRDELIETVDSVKRILLFLCIPAVIGVSILSEDIIVGLFGAAFRPAAMTLRIMSLLIIAVVFNNFYGTQILITFGKEKKLLYSVLIGAIVNVLLNAVLIPKMQQNGAAIASVTSEVMVWLFTRYFSSKYISVKNEKGFLLSTILPAVFMGIAVQMFCKIGLNMIVELVLGILIGIGVYIGFTVIMKNETALVILSEIKKKVRK